MLSVKLVKFNYPFIIADNYRYREEVDNNNSLSPDGEK